MYVNFSTTAYTRMTEPIPYAKYEVGDRSSEQDDVNAIHKEELRVYDIDENVDAALKQYVIATV